MARAFPCSLTKSSLPWPVPVFLVVVSAGHNPALEPSNGLASPTAPKVDSGG